MASWATIRCFKENERLATAVWTSKGEILQVFPNKQVFGNEESWHAYWIHKEPTLYVVKETKEEVASKRVAERIQKAHEQAQTILAKLKEKYAAESPIVQRIRQVYMQQAMPNTMNDKNKVLRKNPLIFAKTGTEIVPVYFNYSTGSYKLRKWLGPLNELVEIQEFYRCDEGSLVMHKIEENPQTLNAAPPNRKVVLWVCNKKPGYYGSKSHPLELKKLLEKVGFQVNLQYKYAIPQKLRAHTLQTFIEDGSVYEVLIYLSFRVLKAHRSKMTMYADDITKWLNTIHPTNA